MPIVMSNQGIDFSNSGTQTTPSVDKGKLISIASYTSAGTYTWTKPTGCTKVLAVVLGAGGGGAGHCESGGAGGYAEKLIDVTSVSTVTVTVGAGGGAVGYYAAAGDGGSSSFGAYCSATGGYGANRNANHTGGHGGVGSGGDVNLLGGSGTGHSNNGSQQAIGNGGRSFFGGGKKSAHNNSNPNNIGYTAPGAGGAGANQTYAYSNGAAGAVIVYSYR